MALVVISELNNFNLSMDGPYCGSLFKKWARDLVQLIIERLSYLIFELINR